MTPCSLVLALLLGAPAPKDRVVGSLVGEWEAESSQNDGQTFRHVPGEIVFIFTADGRWTLTSHRPESDHTPKRAYTTNTAAVPAAIDLESTEDGPMRKTMSGIYKVEGDTFTICFTTERGGRRPAKFDLPVKGSPNVLITFKRVKPKD